ncbi:site-specific DNA-methyltransferase [Marinobacter shengliensis]|uniref:site-specific DNA-methyltransferase n=1 Tax=Marinobacter shengliensis TaxID=1389223 RepID=UPI000D0EE18F|nr:site-specific DNA-methyltransferase [Marinobacter shengliensis]PSF15180.1 site-specific DNA-methyltransferase [Marinobacter shengliensis]
MSTPNTQMNGQSLDIAEQRRRELEQLFPGIFTETRNDQGELKITIDLERLKAELGEFTDIYDSRRERYGMDWPGKRDCLRLIQQPSTATLKPCREESVDFDATENLFIEGDNLEVLKLLQKSYYGKVKMIYIDPPYNTGKEFIYPDNFSESLDTYLQYAGLKDSEGRTFSTNTANEGRFHTKWLNMMYPRLYLARNLLREDGVIFISIDDNEVENLRRMCDEIFGEENQIACLVWEKGRKNDAKLFSVGHEYMLVYARSSSVLKEKNIVWREEKPGAKEIWEQYLLLRERHGKQDAAIESDLQAWFAELPKSHPSKKWSRYKRIDKNGPWRDRDISWPGGGGPEYDVIHPVTQKPCVVPESGWRFANPDEMKRQIKAGLVEFREDHTKPPFRKTHLKPIAEELEDDAEDSVDDEGLATQVRGSYIYKQSQVAVKYLKGLMGAKLFNNPKDHVEIKRLIKYVCGEEGVILDFFSGSGTTGESVAELAIEDCSELKYILVQLPEPNSEKEKTGKAALKAGYSTIADISKDRLRKVYSGLEAEHGRRAQHENKWGFKVLKLGKSNFKLWQAPAKDVSDEELLKQMELNVDHIDPNASQEDLLYELLIKAGVMPTEKVEQVELAGHTMFSVAEGSLLVHLEDDIDQALIDVVLAKAPGQFICLDKAFHGNDQLKTNAVKTFEAFNQGKEKIDQIDFKTV